MPMQGLGSPPPAPAVLGLARRTFRSLSPPTPTTRWASLNLVSQPVAMSPEPLCFPARPSEALRPPFHAAQKTRDVAPLTPNTPHVCCISYLHKASTHLVFFKPKDPH